MTKRIGLTGGIACGKTEVSKRLMQRGIPVLDTDEVAHQLLNPGNPVYDAVLQHFGPDILTPSDEIDRRKLGRCVFADEGERQVLNNLMHPEICRRWRLWLTDQTAPLAVVAIPLLFEIGVEDDFEGVLCIQAPETMMMERLIKRNLNKQEALARIQSQMPVAQKAKKSNWTLNNHKTLSDLHQQVDNWVNEMIHQENN